MRLTNNYLEANNKIGLLFCHTPLIKFYSRHNWILLSSDKCNEPVLKDGIHAMTYNAPAIVKSLKYKGKLF